MTPLYLILSIKLALPNSRRVEALIQASQARVGFEPTVIPVYKTGAIDHYATEPFFLQEYYTKNFSKKQVMERHVGLEPTLFLLGRQVPCQLGEWRI